MFLKNFIVIMFFLFVFVFTESCSFVSIQIKTPTLKVMFVPAAPKPDGIFEDAWKVIPKTKVILERVRGRSIFADRLPVVIQAVHDGHSIAFMVRWSDSTEDNIKRQWVWDENTKEYRLQEMHPDQCAIMWPLKQSSKPINMQSSKTEASYDVWIWTAGWSNRSGYAQDMTLNIRPRSSASLERAQGHVYPSKEGHWVEIIWKEDAGRGGTLPSPQPFFSPPQSPIIAPGGISGAELGLMPLGSAADVLAYGIYYPRFASTSKNEWQFFKRGAFWFVEFNRPLTTGDSNDIALTGKSPFWFSIAVWDAEGGADHYISKPIKLIIGKTKE